MNKQYEALINAIASAIALHEIAETAYIDACIAYKKEDKQLSELTKLRTEAEQAMGNVSEAQTELHGKIFEKWVVLPADQDDGVGLYVTSGSWCGVLPRLIPDRFWIFDEKEEAKAFCASNPLKRVFYKGDALSGGTN